MIVLIITKVMITMININSATYLRRAESEGEILRLLSRVLVASGSETRLTDRPPGYFFPLPLAIFASSFFLLLLSPTFSYMFSLLFPRFESFSFYISSFYIPFILTSLFFSLFFPSSFFSSFSLSFLTLSLVRTHPLQIPFLFSLPYPLPFPLITCFVLFLFFSLSIPYFPLLLPSHLSGSVLAFKSTNVL